MSSIMKNSTAPFVDVCLIGARGMLGTELVRACGEVRPQGPLDSRALDIDEIDITDAGSVDRTLARLKPRVVINAAAFTDVDGCESQEAAAMAVNADGPGHLADACRSHGGRLVHVSTDYVFDGTAQEPYEPDHPVNPLSAYGRTKAEGERRVRESLDDHVIVRTSWLFGRNGKNFVKTMLRLGRERDELRVVTDQVGRPTYARHLAQALLKIGNTQLRGTYHFCNAGSCSWNEFAAEIMSRAGLRAQVQPMTSAELDRPAPRPAYAVLSTASLERDAGIRIAPWREALASCLVELGECDPSPAGGDRRHNGEGDYVSANTTL